ncbi:MAG: hypothetical protein ABSA39_14495 [Edaphobacter sp.]
MIPLRFIATRSAALALLLPCFALIAQTATTPLSIQQKLESDFTVSKAAADKSDIVTAGAVLVLKKDGLLMSATSTGSPAANTYRDGKISQGIWKIAKMPGFGGLVSHASPNTTVQTRTFVAGEKFWVTKITVNPDGVIFDLLSDPISDVRYCSTLRFPFNKGTLPTPDDADTSVGEVFKVDPGDAAADDKGNKGGKGDGKPASSAAASAPAPAAPAEAAAPAPMAPIAPPPPPADTPPPAPKTIALNQTKDEVVANFGPPTKIVKLGTKEIDYYPDMKVTFVNNKVTDVQ